MVVHKFKKTIIETYSRETFFLPYKGEGLELSKAYSKSLQSREEYNWDERIKYRLEHGSDEYIKAFDRSCKYSKSKDTLHLATLNNIVKEGDVIQCIYDHEEDEKYRSIKVNYVTGEIIEASEPITDEYTVHVAENLIWLSKTDPDTLEKEWYATWYTSPKEKMNLKKEYSYTYEIAHFNDSIAFTNACLLIEKEYPELEQKSLIVDPDASAYQFYYLGGKEIRVIDDYDEGKVWVDSEVDLNDLFENFTEIDDVLIMNKLRVGESLEK